MSEQKHFKYDGHVELKMSELKKRMSEVPKQGIKVKDVEFLVPVKVTYETPNNGPFEVMGHIDFARQTSFFEGFGEEMRKSIFDYLKEATTLPENNFALDGDEVKKAMEEADRQLKEHTKKGDV
jgi:hypothetical protein